MRDVEAHRDLAGIERVVVAAAVSARTPTPRRSRAASTAGGVAVFPADTVYGLACDPATPTRSRGSTS